NVEWQRDLIVSNVLLAEVGSRPADRYREALTVARERSASGRLVPADMRMIDDLEEGLAAAGAGKDASRQEGPAPARCGCRPLTQGRVAPLIAPSCLARHH